MLVEVHGLSRSPPRLSSTRNNLFDKLDALVLCLQHKFQVQGAATLVDEALLTVVTLLEEMRQKGPEPNVITCNAAISACEKGKQPDKASELPLRTCSGKAWNLT